MRFILIILLCFSFLQFNLSAEKNFAWVKLYTGDVKIKPVKSKRWFVPKIGMALKNGDVIKTGKKSWITIAFENSSLARFSQNSKVKIAKLEYDIKTKKLKSRLKIPGLGKIISIIRKLKKGKAPEFDVETPTAVIGVRGTEFMVDVPDEDTSIFAVFEGKVIVKDFVAEQGISTDDMEMMLDFLHEISLESGRYTIYKKGKGFTKSKTIGKKYQHEKKIAKELKKEASKLEEELKKRSPEERWKESEKLRKDVLKEK